jgi:hypothetical protein
MNIMITKPISPVTGDSVVDVLSKRLSELDIRDAQLLEQILALEKVGAHKNDAPAAELSRAARLLQGEEQFDPSYRPPLSPLAALYAERELIRKALLIGRSRLSEEMFRRGTEIWTSHFDEIAALEKRRVFLAIELQHVDLERERLREKLQQAGAPGHLPTDGIVLLDIPRSDDEVQRAGERLITQKVATRREIEKARNG